MHSPSHPEERARVARLGPAWWGRNTSQLSSHETVSLVQMFQCLKSCWFFSSTAQHEIMRFLSLYAAKARHPKRPTETGAVRKLRPCQDVHVSMTLLDAYTLASLLTPVSEINRSHILTYMRFFGLGRLQSHTILTYSDCLLMHLALCSENPWKS